MSIRILHGDCRDVLTNLPIASVQCCVTSPPYFGLRAYLADDHPDKASEIGAETTPTDYIAALVGVFREVRRVLRDDGTLWLNLGDSYASGEIGRHDHKQAAGICVGEAAAGRSFIGTGMGAREQRRLETGLPAKNLLMIPARVALALQADGWWLRSDIIWHKPNPMPESVTDRPTSAHEHVFLLTKSPRYFYDAEAVREGAIYQQNRFADPTLQDRYLAGGRINHAPGGGTSPYRNIRNVWTIATAPYTGAHFATFPPELAERCIKAGSKPGDTILDPFAGAFTTAMVADRLQRHAIGIELNPAYCDMARTRITKDAGMFADITGVDPAADAL